MERRRLRRERKRTKNKREGGRMGRNGIGGSRGQGDEEAGRNGGGGRARDEGEEVRRKKRRRRDRRNNRRRNKRRESLIVGRKVMGHGSIYNGCVFLSRCDRTLATGKIDLVGRKSMVCSELEMKSMTNDVW